MADWHDKLLKLIEDRGLTPVGLSLKAGLSRTFVQKLVQREGYPSLENSYRLAAVLDVTLDEFFHGSGYSAPRTLPLMGVITEDGWVRPVGPGDPQGFEVPALGTDTVSFLVQSADCWPYLEGDFLVGTKTLGRSVHNLVGIRCIVATKDGSRHVGVLEPGAGKSRYDIRPFNPTKATIKNVEIEWAAPIKLVVHKG